MTLYQVARDSKVAEALAEASENGKEVEVFVELKARFDEENNIEWSRRLEQSGCHVIYGIEHIKVHSKLCLITWEDENGQTRILSQIGTGNYNEKTSRIYTDLSLITADPAIGQDGLETFMALKEGGVIDAARKLLASPADASGHDPDDRGRDQTGRERPDPVEAEQPDGQNPDG